MLFLLRINKSFDRILFKVPNDPNLVIISLASNMNLFRAPVIHETMPARNLRTCAVDSEFLGGLVILADGCCKDHLCIQKAISCEIE